MAALSTVVAAASLAVAVGSGVASYAQNRQSKRAQARAEEEQEAIRNEQLAANAGQRDAERRQQIREERIRRAQILQSASNTGTSGSAGEAGALGSLATQQATNIGMNQGAYMRGQRISAHSQAAADFMGDARTSAARGQMFGGISQLGTSIFQSAGGWGSVRNIFTDTPKAPPGGVGGFMTQNLGGLNGSWGRI